ncbi:MAG: nuclear transport factor 2 family protein [Myxococcota bacterium]|nr:nuclear transport factor 2 family protein [Myxococcota bacterium]
MDNAEKNSIERACERLVVAYTHHVDHGQASRIPELFTQDGRWSAPGIEMLGREQLRSGFARREANRGRMSRHVCTNFLCEVEDAEHASGVVYLTLYRHDGAVDRRTSPLESPVLVGEYRDRFVRTREGWRMASRQLEVSFSKDGLDP